jgi:hypothetical protein
MDWGKCRASSTSATDVVIPSVLPPNSARDAGLALHARVVSIYVWTKVQSACSTSAPPRWRVRPTATAAPVCKVCTCFLRSGRIAAGARRDHERPACLDRGPDAPGRRSSRVDREPRRPPLACTASTSVQDACRPDQTARMTRLRGLRPGRRRPGPRPSTRPERARTRHEPRESRRLANCQDEIRCGASIQRPPGTSRAS